MAKKTVLNLAKGLDFTTESEYFDYCVDSHINGNFPQCRELFKDMKKEDQKRLLRHIENNYHGGEYAFYFNLL
jgi:hypothetical protein